MMNSMASRESLVDSPERGQENKNSDRDSGSVEEYDVEEILELISIGWFHYRLLIICGALS